MTDIVETSKATRQSRATDLPGRAAAVARLPADRYADFLPTAEAIAQRRHAPLATWLIVTLSAMVIAIITWMHVARIDEVVSAPAVVRATANGLPFEIVARVSSADVGMIAPGQDAFIKVHAFDWTRHGMLKGKVVDITDVATAPSFITRIAIDKAFLGDDPQRARLLAGMTATVDFHVGERSILSFFTSGFLGTVGPSLRERN
ncbi:hypothetical protein [Reyranella sp. CPCC 100927]|uniref:hypothetical protein n=1 Tax=Reyranella sp. CPCC 100927 TaxID=2599616 RepID=UPI0011B6135B|nr:hypothetical protein [Reyranella sp. CPCC 100927]TWT14984.1 hypothetical protein FQU96_01035 [Reyranella sp. CPCC 100927]